VGRQLHSASQQVGRELNPWRFFATQSSGGRSRCGLHPAWNRSGHNATILFCGLLAQAIPAALFAKPSYDGISSGLRNAVILIIRHAEDADHGYGLSSAGDARTGAYVSYFKTLKVDGQPLKLDHLFAAKDSPNSHRPRLTIEPIGNELGLTVDSRFDSKHFLDMVHEIQSRPEGANILICWHHRKIPQLLRALGADPKTLLPKGKCRDDVFGWVVQLRYDENGHLFESKRIDEHSSLDDSGTHPRAAAR
jgi:hypothetical protein